MPKYLFFTPHSLLQTHSLLTGSSGNDLLVQGSKELDRITVEYYRTRDGLAVHIGQCFKNGEIAANLKIR